MLPRIEYVGLCIVRLKILFLLASICHKIMFLYLLFASKAAIALNYLSAMTLNYLSALVFNLQSSCSQTAQAFHSTVSYGTVCLSSSYDIQFICQLWHPVHQSATFYLLNSIQKSAIYIPFKCQLQQQYSYSLSYTSYTKNVS